MATVPHNVPNDANDSRLFTPYDRLKHPDGERIVTTRILLGGLGVVYILLAIWCAAMPEQTSKAVGFTLQPGAGQSEFITVYGGFELALGLIFLWPLFRPASLEGALRVCLLMHACLVLFRTSSFLLFEGIPATTKYFAIGEWLIFLLSLLAVVLANRSPSSHHAR